MVVWGALMERQAATGAAPEAHETGAGSAPHAAVLANAADDGLSGALRTDEAAAAAWRAAQAHAVEYAKELGDKALLDTTSLHRCEEAVWPPCAAQAASMAALTLCELVLPLTTTRLSACVLAGSRSCWRTAGCGCSKPVSAAFRGCCSRVIAIGEAVATSNVAERCARCCRAVRSPSGVQTSSTSACLSTSAKCWRARASLAAWRSRCRRWRGRFGFHGGACVVLVHWIRLAAHRCTVFSPAALGTLATRFRAPAVGVRRGEAACQSDWVVARKGAARSAGGARASLRRASNSSQCGHHQA